MPLFDRAADFFRGLQTEICDALAAEDGAGVFGSDEWQRPGGGGGVSRVLADGGVFEKAGVNWSHVEGELGEELAGQLPGQGRSFRATGISLVLHPRSPMVPTTHANFRCIQKEERMWFGGGADLTPYYLFDRDAEHFHGAFEEVCDAHAPIGDYPRFSKWCDEYFYLPHRGEQRGLGGIFFDYLEGDEPELERTFDFVRAAGRAFSGAYLPIVQRRRDEPWGDAERQWQLMRRGRYVEFNLLYDRGTVFGLKTGGRIESILMSLPPLVRWDYMPEVEPGSREAAVLEALKSPK
jgi:coproporphyrinogen III oxidase